MKVFLALSLLTLVLLSACAPQAEQPAAAPASVEQLGDQVSEVSNVESDLDPSGLDSIDKTLAEIETG